MKFRILILILFILSSCSKFKENENPGLSYTVLNSVKIPIAPDVQYEHSQIQMVGGNKFVGLDRNFRKLDFFSLEKNKFLSSTKFKNDGPNWIYPVSSFYYHNKDSIFLFSLDASAFQLINQKGQVKNSIRIDDNQYPPNISEDIIGTDNQFFPISITQNDGLFIPFFYDSKNEEMIFNIVANSYLDGFNDRQTFYSAPIVSNFDLRTLEFKNFLGKWPKEKYNQQMTPNNVFTGFCLNTNNHDRLINFYNADKIYSVNENKFFNVESNHVKNDITLFDIENQKEYSTEEELDALNDDEAYVNLIYDPFENLYYRIFKYSTHGSVGSVHKMEANWSLIAFTPKFKVLGEVEFPASVYNFLQILPTEKGLLISKENAWSKENNEQKYEFDLVKIDF